MCPTFHFAGSRLRPGQLVTAKISQAEDWQRSEYYHVATDGFLDLVTVGANQDRHFQGENIVSSSYHLGGSIYKLDFQILAKTMTWQQWKLIVICSKIGQALDQGAYLGLKWTTRTKYWA